MTKTRLTKKALLLISLSITLVLLLSACGGSGGANTSGANTGGGAGSAGTSGGSTSSGTTATTTGSTSSNFDASRDISIIAREDGSGTKSAFMEIIGLRGKADPEKVIIQTGTAGVLAEVKGNPAAIAYESLGYVTSDVKMLKVDGVEATVANIKNGSYKISRPLSVVYQESSIDNDLNQAFFNFLQSSDAQEIISDSGYVSIVDGASAYTINGALSGSIDISGSTSLQPLMIDLASAFEDLQSNVQVNVSGGGSGTGYKNADDGVSEFGMISEEFDITKAPGCTHYIVSKDGIAVIVNGDNPLDDISMAQLSTIYDVDADEEAITKWDALIK